MDRRIKTGTISSGDRAEYDYLQQTVGHSLNSARITDNNATLYATAEWIQSFTKTDADAQRLKEILATPIEKMSAWMCAPVFRDAILFYDDKDMLVSGINICFECERMYTVSGVEIVTDFKAYGALKKLLLSWDHPIESP